MKGEPKMILFKLEWRGLQKSLVVWSILFIGLISIFGIIYPQMYTPEMRTTMDQMLNGLSPELLKSFNIISSGPASLLTATGFFGYYFQYMFIAACIFACLSGSNALIKEESDGTIEFLYAQPITRVQIVLQKFIAHGCKLLIFWGVSWSSALVVFLGTKQQGDSLGEFMKELTRVFLSEFLILLFFLALGFLFSTLLTSSKQAPGISLGTVFGFYVVGIISGLLPNLENLKNISPVSLGIPATIIQEKLHHSGIIASFTVLFFIASLYLYQKKDLHV